MSLRARALVAVGLLIGFYLLALGMTAALVALSVVTLSHGQVIGGLLYPTAVAVFGVLPAVFSLDRRALTLQRAGAVPVTRVDQPHLWRLVDDVAARTFSSPPETVLLGWDANAGVLQSGHLLGLLPGRKTMVIGYPLLTTLSESQLRAVLAHEFGHHLAGDTRVGAVLYRGQVALTRAYRNSRRSIVRLFIEQYAELFVHVSAPISRQQEFAADRLAASVAGPDQVASALVATPVIHRAWNNVVRSYVQPALRHDRLIVDALTALPDVVRNDASGIETAVNEALNRDPRDGDTHPPLSERLRALGDPSTQPMHEAAAARLLVAPDQVEQQLSRVAIRDVLGYVSGQPMLIADYPDTVFAEDQLEAAKAVLRAVAACDGDRRPYPPPRPLAELLTMLEDGRADRLARFTPTELRGIQPKDQLPHQRQSLKRHAIAAIGEALVAHNQARRTLTLGGSAPASYLLGSGARFDLAQAVSDAVEEPANATKLRRRLERHLDTTWAPPIVEHNVLSAAARIARS